MANIVINDKEYNGVDYVRIPSKDNSGMVSVYKYYMDCVEDKLFPIRQGDVTLNGIKLTCYDGNKFLVEYGSYNSSLYMNVSDYLLNSSFSSENASMANVTNKAPILSLKSGDVIRLVVSSNTSDDINSSGNQISVNMPRANTNTVENLFALDDVTRDSVAHTITAEKTLDSDFEVGAIMLYKFINIRTSTDVTLNLYVNDVQLL